MKPSLKQTVVLSLAAAAGLGTAATPVAALDAMQEPQQGVAAQFTPFTQQQLEELVAPIALYADPLLAQVLLASTFPDQIASAAAWVRANGTEGVDDQYWDVSVKAVAHYPTVLNQLDNSRDWAMSLGQAYAAQSSDVMRAVQSMRQRAQAQGNLRTTPEQQVVVEREYIRIWPAQPQVIYVPVYDPIVYYEPVFYRPGFHFAFSWGLPFRIGAWLIYDCDWPLRRIYYTGWSGGGWIARSRPHIHITNVYVNPGYRRVWYDRDVLRRRPDYGRGFAWARAEPGRGVARARDDFAEPREPQRAVVRGTTTRGTASPPADRTPPRWTPGNGTRTDAPFSLPGAGNERGGTVSGGGYSRDRAVPTSGTAGTVSGGGYRAPRAESSSRPPEGASITRSPGLPSGGRASSAPSITRAPRAESSERGSSGSVTSGGYRAPSSPPRVESSSAGRGSARAVPRASSSSGGGSSSPPRASTSRGSSGSSSAPRAQARARERG